MKIQGSVAFVTGSNRGIGKSYVTALLEQGAKTIYAGIRDIRSFKQSASRDWEQHPGKVEPVEIDITNEKHINAAVVQAGDVNLLINNAGIANFNGLIAADNLDPARQEMDVNYFGTLLMCRAFAPVLERNGGGALINILSVAGLGNFPVLGTYCSSKTALHSLTQGIRAELAAQGTRTPE